MNTGDDYHRTQIKKPDEPYKGLDAHLYALSGWVGSGPGKIGEFLARAHQIDEMAAAFSSLAEGALRARLLDFREQFRRGARGYRELVPTAFAALREAAARHIGLRPYEVQLAGSIALYEGFLIEMATGEGKTLTAALAAILRGWTGLPCHVITVNDYLAERDSRWMEPLYRFASVSVGCVTGGMEPGKRREGYRQEVAYTTNKEIVADFLRDRLWLGKLQHVSRRSIARFLGGNLDIDRGLVMRGIHAAIVDEADSLLIDEAVTPLIISRSEPNDLFLDACTEADTLAASLQKNVDYQVNTRYKEIELLPHFHERLPQAKRFSGYADLVRHALSAREFFARDNQYLIQDGKVIIVDEFTGRQMPQRTWRFGLHQMIEAKEGIGMSPPTETLARLSFQRFYRFFDLLSGMTGTAHEAAGELWAIYNLPVVTIPVNRPSRRRLYPTRAFPDLEGKWQAIVREIAVVHNENRPILVGTRSVRDSEELSARLQQAGLQHMVLNAVRHREEAGIVGLAGSAGAITIATNMAGRGTDIALGKGVAEIGGLHVIACEANESGRIDRQLFGRCARQGDRGSARLYLSAEDDVMKRFLPSPARLSLKTALRLRVPGAGQVAAGALRIAQSNAQRLAVKRRRAVLRMDTWLENSLSFAHREIS